MKIVYYTSGVSGIGRVVQGISINNALRRFLYNDEFIILSSTPYARSAILDHFTLRHIEIPPEDATALSAHNYKQTIIYSTLQELQPDILISDRMWFTLHNFIQKLSCKKIFICSQVDDIFFTVPLPYGTLSFQRDQYDRVIAIEPFRGTIEMEQINPLVIRNRDEILPREQALKGLGFDGSKPVCFIGVNFKEGYFEQLKEKYSYIEKQGYDVVYSTNMAGAGIFPIADYYNAIDLIIAAATYNQFWEARYFRKEAVFETLPANFCDMERRISECSDYEFEINGADQLADIIMNL